MESELFEEILLGDFPDFTKVKTVKTWPGVLKAGKLLDVPMPADRKGVLSFRKKLFEMITTLTGMKREIPAAPATQTDPVLHPDNRYYKPVLPVSSGSEKLAERLFCRLTECESSLLLGSLLPFLSEEKDNEDAVYFGNLAIRKWSDYLNQTSSGERRKYVLRHHLFAMLCDLSERLRESNEDTADSFSIDLIRNFFSNKYDTTKPVYPTNEFTNVRLKRISRESEEIRKERLVGMLTEMASLLQENPDDPEVVRDLSESISSIEQALILLELKVPLLNDHPEKIGEPEYRKERVSDLKRDLTKELTPGDFGQIVHAVDRIDAILQSIPGAETVNKKMNVFSDVREIIRSVQAVHEYLLKDQPSPPDPGTTVNAGNGEKRSTNDELAGEIANQFLTKDQVKEIFNLNSNDTYKEFLDRHKLNYLEVSTHNHLYYRSEVMKLLEKIKKRGGK